MTQMDRRQFAGMFATLGLASNSAMFADTASSSLELLHLSRNGWVPNNETLPVLLYRSAIDASGQHPAANFERAFLRNGWPPQWRNGVYDFHHFHSTAHEVLGFASGEARLMLGGENGHEVTVRGGDVVVLPTGTGHRKLTASPDFLVVGAYPPDQIWDICRTTPSAEAIDRMRHLSFPASDPVSGISGALPRLWHNGV